MMSWVAKGCYSVAKICLLPLLAMTLHHPVTLAGRLAFTTHATHHALPLPDLTMHKCLKLQVTLLQ